jgi:predicted nucleic acid-binding protein
MDAYLAAFATAGGLRMVTLDRDFKTFVPHGLDLNLLSM